MCDSPMPYRCQVRVTGRGPPISTSRRARRGITSSVNIFSISRGTPGRKNASAVPSGTTNPGAIPAVLGSAFVPFGMRT